MRDQEAKMQARVEEFVTAAQDLHSSGEAWFYILDVAREIALNDDAFMRRRKVAGHVLSLFGRTQHPDPMKWFGSGTAASLYPVAARLEGNGVLRSEWEDRLPEDPNQPRRRLYQLVENPDDPTQAA